MRCDSLLLCILFRSFYSYTLELQQVKTELAQSKHLEFYSRFWRLSGWHYETAEKLAPRWSFPTMTEYLWSPPFFFLVVYLFAASCWCLSIPRLRVYIYIEKLEWADHYRDSFETAACITHASLCSFASGNWVDKSKCEFSVKFSNRLMGFYYWVTDFQAVCMLLSLTDIKVLE